jgi:hypothetical protein
MADEPPSQWRDLDAELRLERDRADAAEHQAAEAQARADRAEVAAANGVPESLLENCDTREEMIKKAAALKQWRACSRRTPDFGHGDRTVSDGTYRGHGDLW